VEVDLRELKKREIERKGKEILGEVSDHVVAEIFSDQVLDRDPRHETV